MVRTAGITGLEPVQELGTVTHGTPVREVTQAARPVLVVTHGMAAAARAQMPVVAVTTGAAGAAVVALLPVPVTAWVIPAAVVVPATGVAMEADIPATAATDQSSSRGRVR
jgi:hypothetical protein